MIKNNTNIKKKIKNVIINIDIMYINMYIEITGDI